MAGPSLSHILDPPRPTTERDIYSTPPSYAHHDNLRHPHQQDQQQQGGSAGAPAAHPRGVSPNTRNLSTPPVSLPPPTPTSSTLQVRPAPTSGSVPLPVLAAAGATASSASTPTESQQGRGQLEPGAASAGTTNTTGASQSTNHRGNNLYACRDCGRSYSRPEHLVRHVQTHTLGRRFVCEICQKTFARKDLLRRHVANHDNDSPKKRRRTTTSPGGGRVSHACRSCAIARVKCDDTKPCKRCVSRKLPCVSTEAPSTAAMHLMHFSANAHSSTGNTNNDNIDNENKQPVTAHYPGSFGHHQPRSLSAPHSEPPPQHQQRHARTSSTATFPSSQANPPSNKPGTSEYHTRPFSVELEPAGSAMALNRLPFADFLRDVLDEDSAGSGRAGPIQGLSVLDFCDYNSLELTDDDFGLLDHWNVDGNHTLAQGVRYAGSSHGRDSSADVAQVRQDLVKMWTNSSWSPDLRAQDGVSKEQRNMATTTGGSDSIPETRDRTERVIPERLEHSARDRMLAIVLSTCRPGPTLTRIASSFPSADVMDTLIQNFLMSLAHQVSEWIHFPTFRLNAQSPEWIAIAAASGAALSSIPTLQRFGFILQDAARATLPTQFEDDATTIRDVSLIQALLLTEEIGLWSGNRRRMELAQSHLAIPVTLMRYRNKFQRSSYPAITVDPQDEGAELEEKWRRWVHREQWKRLVFHYFLRDAQCSMATLTNSAISYAELTLPLPESRELWLARNPAEWKAEYLQRHGGQGRAFLSLGDLLHDIHMLPGHSQQVDFQFSVSVYLHGFWALILEYRKLSAVCRPRSYTGSMGGSQNLLLSSRQQELVKELQSLQLMAQEWQDMTAQEYLLLNLLIMNLHISLDDLELFAGKEGEDQARRIYPVLQQWASSSEARSAIWYAGQVLRYAKAFPPGHLKDFYAAAVHHAALTLWAYGVITKANRRHTPLPSQYPSENIYLDGSETVLIQRFRGFGQGQPAIRGPMVKDAVSESGLEDPRGCMEIAQQVLRSNFKNGADSLPTMVENLCIVMRQLGDAAWAVNLGP